jgi:osmoprotectant transport system substrate-binding protein
MRVHRTRLFAALAALTLLAAACGGNGDDGANGDGGDTATSEVPDGPTITVASFNFPESSILAEIYGQALEDAGYPVEYQLNLGSRELIFPELRGGELDLLPEYLGSSIVVGFGEEPPEDVDAGVEQLQSLFEEDGITVLEPAPAENTNVFVTTREFAEENDLQTLEDLADAGPIVFGGPPECEERDVCYRGLVDGYGLDNVEFEAIQEGAARLAALQSGQNQLTLLFSTDAVFADGELVALEETQGIIPPENITPVIRSEVLDAYGDDLRDLLNRISAEITVEDLQAMNAQASEGLAPDEIAAEWLADKGFIE